MNNYAQEILTAGVTDFATPLQKRNAERLAQITESQAEWVKHGAATVTKAKEESLVKVFEGFEKLSKTAATLAKAKKTSVDSKKSKEITALFNNIKSGEVKSVQGAIGLAFEEGRLKRDLSEFKNSIAESLNNLKTFLDNNKDKKIIGYGASGRANVVVGTLDLDESYIDYIIDE